MRHKTCVIYRGVAAQVEVAVVVAALADHVRQHQAQAQVGEGGLGGKLSDPALRQKRAAEPLHLLRHLLTRVSQERKITRSSVNARESAEGAAAVVVK